MAHAPWHSARKNDSKKTYTGQHSGYTGSYSSNTSSSGSQSATQQKSEAEIEAGYMTDANKSVKHNFNTNNSNADTDSSSTGFINENHNKVTNNNELSELDKIAEQNAKTTTYQTNLAKSIEQQKISTKKWGLDSYADKNLNGGKIDTSPGVVDEITELHDAAKKMAVILGLNPNKKKDLQKALNFLSGDEWGSQRTLATSKNFAEIQALKNSKEGGWKTWGTGLRGDSRWKGVGPLEKDKYSSALTAMAANVQAGTPAFDYHRALVNSHKPLKSDAGLLETIFSSFIPGASLLKDSGLVNWLNEHNNVDKIGVDENGIFNFEYNGAKVNVNNGSPFTDTEWKTFLKQESDSDGGNYSTYSYDNTNQIEDPLEDVEDDDTVEEEYNTSDEYAPWYDFTLFERMFSMTGDTGQKIDLQLGYGPKADMAYTTSMPKTGYTFTYDKDGTRYEVKEGEKEGTIDGKTYKFKSLNKENTEGDK